MTADRHEAPAQTTDSFAALMRLRTDILTGVFEPGRWLRLVDLRQRYDLGASPLREALSKLAAEQLVVQEANRGFRVPLLDPHEFGDLADLRRKLEPDAARRSVERGDDAWEEQLLLAHRRLKRLGAPAEILDQPAFDERAQRWEGAHRTFHATLIAACASPWTQRFCLTLGDQFDRYRRFARPGRAVQQALAAQHDAMLEHALERRADACAALLDEHVRLTAEAVLEALQRGDGHTTVPPSTRRS